VKKSHARIPLACALRNSDQEGPSLRGASPRPWRRSRHRIVVAPTRMPRPRSSPWIRTHPQRGFSLARRRMRSVTCGDGRALCPFGTIGPLASDQFPVPEEERRGPNEEGGPALAREHPGYSGQEGSVRATHALDDRPCGTGPVVGGAGRVSRPRARVRLQRLERGGACRGGSGRGWRTAPRHPKGTRVWARAGLLTPSRHLV